MGKKAGLKANPCPCGSGLAFDACCGRYLRGEPAPTPEALMRSRYTAYALGADDYVLSTWAADTRPDTLFEAGDSRPKWISLEVLSSEEKGNLGSVHFVARARTSQGALRMEEHSRFRRENGFWFYVDGDVD